MPVTAKEIIDWCNQNDGVIGAVSFVTALVIGWASGFFRWMRHRPRLVIGLIPGPNLCSKVATGNTLESGDEYRTAIALYLKIANTGSAPTDIGDIRVAYRTDALRWEHARWWQPLSRFEPKIERFHLLYRWFKINDQTVALEDFTVEINEEKRKHFPFLVQRGELQWESQNTYLEIGRKTTGIVYFESTEYSGGYEPKVRDDKVAIIVKIDDAYGGTHKFRTRIPRVTLDEARKYSPSFGSTYQAIATRKDTTATGTA